MPSITDFLTQSERSLLPYQARAISAYANGDHGLIEAPTGRGKTMAMALAIIQNAQQNNRRPKVLWVTPMRALARDSLRQLTDIFEWFFPDIRLILRTSDSSSSQKKKARTNDWDILITTPESCALFTTYEDMTSSLDDVQTLVVDEWHVLMHQKRGILFELFLSWFHQFNSTCRRWALSATMASTKDAAKILCPNDHVVCIKDDFKKQIVGDVLLPDQADATFRSLGRQLILPLIEKIQSVTSAIIFTNTRSQSEQWFQLLLDSNAFQRDQLAIHHSAVAASDRSMAEAGIKSGAIRCIVATSSLDLGVDLEPVDLVIHIGSPKGMARLKQRAGRSGHSPFESAAILMVPRHGFEVIESVAAISNLSDDVRDDVPYHGMPMDVLMQHLINVCMGTAYQTSTLIEMVTSTYTYASLSQKDLQWLLDFCCNEHTLLKAYPEHVKLIKKDDEYSTNPAPLIQKSQRFGVGTITSEDYLIVKYTNQKTLGTIEEQFIRQLEPNDTFLFSGHVLAVVRIQDDIVFVKKSKRKLPKYTRWYGGYMSYSSQLADYMLTQMTDFHASKLLSYPLAQRFLDWQQRDSMVPKSQECLIEILTVDDCPTLFLYPFCGRAANQALAMGLTHAMSKQFKCLTAMTVNDYGLMIQLDQDVNIQSFDFKQFLSVDSIRDLSHASFNHNEMILQEFRQICMVSGLIYKGMPGRLKSGRYTQSSVRILYDIFKDYDPDNLLLKQAREVVFHSQLFPQRLHDRLQTISEHIIIQTPRKVTPFGYTLYQEQLSAKMDGNGH